MDVANEVGCVTEDDSMESNDEVSDCDMLEVLCVSAEAFPDDADVMIEGAKEYVWAARLARVWRQVLNTGLGDLLVELIWLLIDGNWAVGTKGADETEASVAGAEGAGERESDMDGGEPDTESDERGGSDEGGFGVGAGDDVLSGLV
jgi:hypothetical protein